MHSMVTAPYLQCAQGAGASGGSGTCSVRRSVFARICGGLRARQV